MPRELTGVVSIFRQEIRPIAPSRFAANGNISVSRRPSRLVPTANPKQLTGPRESVDSPIDGRSLQNDLVRLDRGVPTAGRVGSRKPCPSPSAQRAAAQIPEASRAQRHRPAVACWPLSPGPRGAGRSENYKAGDAAALAPCRLRSLLALEIPPARWPAKYAPCGKTQRRTDGRTHPDTAPPSCELRRRPVTIAGAGIWALACPPRLRFLASAQNSTSSSSNSSGSVLAPATHSCMSGIAMMVLQYAAHWGSSFTS